MDPNAPFVLALLARALEKCGLEAVLIGNMAAAVQGAPVTTVDVDFLFRKTPRNMAKLKAFAKSIEGTIMKPFYPVSELYRIQRDSDGLQVDFMPRIDGIKSFEGLKSGATRFEFGGRSMLVADLADIVRSKRAAGRSKDKAVLDTLEKTLHEKADNEERKARGAPKGK